MSTRTAYPATENTGDTWTTTVIDKLPGGWIGDVQVTANQGSITSSSTDITGLSFTVTVNTSRRIMLIAQATFGSTVATDDYALNIQESSTVLTAGQFCGQRTGSTYLCYIMTTLTPTAGSHTYKVTGGRAAGTGTVTMQADATHPASLTVLDIGPA